MTYEARQEPDTTQKHQTYMEYYWAVFSSWS